MKTKHLLTIAAAIIAVAAYTLTLSFTETPSAISRLEALANNESGEGGGTGNENPESGSNGKFMMKVEKHNCQPFRWVEESDGDGGYNWHKIPIGNGPTKVDVTVCVGGTGEKYTLTSCTPYDPCNPAKPTI